MILEHDGTKVYADRVYTKIELDELRAANSRAKAAAQSECEAALKSAAAAQEALTLAQEALAKAEDNEAWVIRALAEFPTDAVSANETVS